MQRRLSLLSRIFLALAVLVLSYAVAYVYALQQKVGSNHTARSAMCNVDEPAKTDSNEGHISDAYVNCSGFQS